MDLEDVSHVFVMVTCFLASLLIMYACTNQCQAKEMAFACKWDKYDVIFASSISESDFHKTFEDDGVKISFYLKDPHSGVADVTVRDATGIKQYASVKCKVAE